MIDYTIMTALLLVVAGLVLAYTNARRRRWWRLALMALCVAVNLVIAGLRLLEPAECRNAPPVVEYHPGMPLCPGQTVVVRIPIPLPPPEPQPTAAPRPRGI